MKANDYEIDGNHYQRVEGEQLWDRLVRLYGLERARCFFIGNVLAYVERYQYKDGVTDLMKARHYLDKLIELEGAAVSGDAEGTEDTEAETQQVAANGTPEPERKRMGRPRGSRSKEAV